MRNNWKTMIRSGWIIFILWMAFAVQGIQAQNEGSVWKTLANLLIEKEFDEMTGMEVYKPTFFPNVLDLEGTEIVVEGYIIPLTGQKAQAHFMFSAYPVNMCFFCGKAGPESAMQVFMKDAKKVAYTEDRITLKGTFKINRNIQEQMFYNLENAEVL